MAIDIDAMKEKKVMTVDGITLVVEDVQEDGNGKVESVILEVDNCCLIGCKRILTPKGVTVGAV
jgi:hypothetical protein